jgi:phage tail protein X
MKKILVAAAVAVVVTVMAGSAFAAGSQTANVNISANVGAAACKAITPAALSIVIPDPSVLAPVASTGGDTTIQCQAGQSTTSITATSFNAGGAPVASPLTSWLANGAYSLNYTLTFAAAVTGSGYGGPGKNQVVIAANGAVATPTGNEGAGVYTDVVTITVAY